MFYHLYLHFNANFVIILIGYIIQLIMENAMKKRLLKPFNPFFLLVCTMILSSCGSDNSSNINDSDSVKELFYDAFKTIASEAMEDPQRLSEITPETTSISLPDYSGDIPDATYNEELDVCTIEMNDHKMQYTIDIMGEPDENGLYPLYIALHGGGEAPAEFNNEQWLQMRDYYSGSITNGIYVATRGMEDVWNLHFIDYSYAMYDRLIEDLVLLGNVDPNRVYLLGFSAGGDGVYAIAPRMADKFAAVNMSSGHPNGVSLLNTANLPFQIQVGIRDFYSEDAMRSVRGAEFENTFNELHETFNFGYPHSVLVHIPNGHNYNDYSNNLGESCVLTDPAEFAERCVKENWLDKFMDVYTSLGYEADVSSLSYTYGDYDLDNELMDLITNDLGMDCTYDTNTYAVDYVSSYTRDPAPQNLVWDLSTRAYERKDSAFYWLKADPSVNEGVICAYYDEESNSVTVIDENVNGDFSILATPFLMDFSRPLTIITSNGEYPIELNADKDVVAASIKETGDMYLGWAQEIPMSELK